MIELSATHPWSAGEEPTGHRETRGDDELAVMHLMYAVTRDRRLRDELLIHYDPYAVRLARAFPSRREDREDLIQVARVGLIHAVDRFDPGRERPFVAFAKVTITGELKRHVRDHTWRLRVARSLQEDYLVVMRTLDDLTQELGRSPRISQVAARAGLTEEQVLEAMEVAVSTSPMSLDQPTGHDGPMIDPGRDDAGLATVEDRQALEDAVARLPERDQEVVRLRFEHELTQSQIAARLGMSQMCVSRVLSRNLRRMRTRLAERPAEHQPSSTWSSTTGPAAARLPTDTDSGRPEQAPGRVPNTAAG